MEIETGTDELLCEVSERVATVTLNRPHKKNSLSDRLTPALRESLSGDYGASWFLNRLVGQGKAKELMYLSERIGAEECARLGLVNAVFAAETFREEARAYAHRLANGPTIALSRMKRNLQRGALQGLRESLALEAEHMVMSFQTQDAREAMRAFAEKRRPQFRFR